MPASQGTRSSKSGMGSSGGSVNDKKRPAVTSTNSAQVLSLSNGNRAEITMDAHYEANYKEKTLLEINRNRLNRKIQKLEETISQPMIVLDKLKTLSWSGIPSCKFTKMLLMFIDFLNVCDPQVYPKSEVRCGLS